MVSSGRRIIISLLLLLTALASTNAQTAANKSSTSTISGKVTLGDKGVSGLTVGLAISTPSSTTYVTQLRAVTDEEGNYRFKKVPPNTYQVLVSSAQYVQSEARTSVVVGKNEVVENINITLLRGGVITGKVTDADGRPVVEEQIFFSSSNALPYWRSIYTDDRGIYRAFGLPPGRYTVAAGKDSMSSFGKATTGYQRTYHPSTVNPSEAIVIDVNDGSEATNVDITLGRQLSKYAAHGRIIDGETSQPLPNAAIGLKFLFGMNGSASSGTAAVSTKDGEFNIENLPAGKYEVYFETDSGQRSEPVRFEVIDQDIEGLVIRTVKGASVSGVAVLEGIRDPSVRTSLTTYQLSAFVSPEYFGHTNINSDGSFRLTGLPAGRLTLRLPETRNHLQVIKIDRDGVVYPRGIEIRDQEQITGLRVIIGQANGKIRGVLKLSEGLQLPPTARLLVYLRNTDDPAVSVSPVRADARGHFLVDGLFPGHYEFNVVEIGRAHV